MRLVPYYALEYCLQHPAKDIDTEAILNYVVGLPADVCYPELRYPILFDIADCYALMHTGRGDRNLRTVAFVYLACDQAKYQLTDILSLAYSLKYLGPEDDLERVSHFVEILVNDRSWYT